MTHIGSRRGPKRVENGSFSLRTLPRARATVYIYRDIFRRVTTRPYDNDHPFWTQGIMVHETLLAKVGSMVDSRGQDSRILTPIHHYMVPLDWTYQKGVQKGSQKWSFSGYRPSRSWISWSWIIRSRPRCLDLGLVVVVTTT